MGRFARSTPTDVPVSALKGDGERMPIRADEGMAPELLPGLRRRGFVTTMAIMLMALVAVVVGTLMMRVSTSARQGRAEREQAQVEQLLLAGMDWVRGDSKAEGEMALPPELAAEGAKLKVIRTGQRVEVEATLGRIVMREAMTGDERATSWSNRLICSVDFGHNVPVNAER